MSQTDPSQESASTDQSEGRTAWKARSSVSIIRNFNVAMVLLYIGGLIVVLVATYSLTRQEVRSQAEKELTLLVDLVHSVRRLVTEDTSEYFRDQDIHFPPVVSPTVAANLVAQKFRLRQPDYYIKVSSDNPLNTTNLPEDLETSLLMRFRNNPDLGRISTTGSLQGGQFLVSATPEVASEGCLRCHGVAAEAPPEILAYGGQSGFGYHVGSVVGVSVVGVPLPDLPTLVAKRGLIAVLLLTLLFAVVFAIINRVVKTSIVRPIVDITENAHAISRGNVERPIRSERNDEIGDLANSFELMRRSLALAIKRYKG